MSIEKQSELTPLKSVTEDEVVINVESLGLVDSIIVLFKARTDQLAGLIARSKEETSIVALKDELKKAQEVIDKWTKDVLRPAPPAH